MRTIILLFLFYLSSYAQNEPIVTNNGLSNTTLADEILSEYELQELINKTNSPKSTSIDYVDKYNRERNQQLTSQETKEQIDFRNNITGQLSGRLTNSIDNAKISQFELEQLRQMASPAIGGLRVDNRIKANTYDTPFNEVYTQLNDGTYKLKSKPSLETSNNNLNKVYTQQSDGTYKLKSSKSNYTFIIVFIIISIIILLVIYKLYNKRPLKVALRNRLDKELKVLVDKLPIDGTYDALEKTISNFELTSVFKVQSYATEYNLTTDEVYEVINQYLYDLREQKEKYINNSI